MIKLISSATSDLVVDQRVHRSCTSLAEMGFDLTSLGREKPNSSKLTDRPYATERLKCFFNKGPLFYIEFNLRLFFKLRSLKPELLLANDLDTLLANTLVSKLYGIPLIYDSHEYFTEVPELIKRPTVRKIWVVIEKYCIGRPVKHITVCKSIAEAYTEKYKVEFSVVRNLPQKAKKLDLDESINLKSLAGSRRIILYQGAVNADRGLEEMIEAMVELEEFLLVIIGGGDVFNKLKVKVKDVNVVDRVHFVGELPFEKLPSITRQADLGLSIEKTESMSYSFALPNKVFDYIQCGIPVLMSNLIELKRLNEAHHFGEIIDEISSDKLALKIKEIVNNGTQLEKYKVSATKAAQLLNWENESEKLKYIFNEFLYP